MRTYGRHWRSGGLFCAALAALPATALAGPRVYRLEATSTFQQGCFDPCDCPIVTQDGVRGTFGLEREAIGDVFTFFKVSDVNWFVPTNTGEAMHVTGSGTYAASVPEVGIQWMELTLSVNGEPPQLFKTGEILGPIDLDKLSLTLSINNMFCFDTVFAIEATPVPAGEIVHLGLANRSTFQQGCFKTCDCLLEEKRLVAGAFDLVKIYEDPLFTEYSVTNLAWRIQPPKNSEGPIDVKGVGKYRVGGEVAVQQQLTLDLTLGTDPVEHLDSGLVVSALPFPRIDVTITMNNYICYDRVFEVLAAPK